MCAAHLYEEAIPKMFFSHSLGHISHYVIQKKVKRNFKKKKKRYVQIFAEVPIAIGERSRLRFYRERGLSSYSGRVGVSICKVRSPIGDTVMANLNFVPDSF